MCYYLCVARRHIRRLPLPVITLELLELAPDRSVFRLDLQRLFQRGDGRLVVEIARIGESDLRVVADGLRIILRDSGAAGESTPQA